jgi:hypothetical protein
MAGGKLARNTIDVRDVGRAVAYAPDAAVATWLREELVASLSLQILGTIREVVAALTDESPPRPQILIADFDAMSAPDTLHLHEVRERWFGVIVALGRVSQDLVKSLRIEHVLTRPLKGDALRRATGGLTGPTTRIPIVK